MLSARQLVSILPSLLMDATFNSLLLYGLTSCSVCSGVSTQAEAKLHGDLHMGPMTAVIVQSGCHGEC